MKLLFAIALVTTQFASALDLEAGSQTDALAYAFMGKKELELACHDLEVKKSQKQAKAGKTCWMNTVARGVGKPIHSCDSLGEEMEKEAFLCYPKCKEGWKGMGPMCTKQGETPYPRGMGKALQCGKHEEYDAGLCYNKCGPNQKAVGPVCMGGCPSDLTECGALCLGQG